MDKKEAQKLYRELDKLFIKHYEEFQALMRPHCEGKKEEKTWEEKVAFEGYND